MAYRAFFHFEQHPYIERKVTYDQQILKVLTEAGDKGLSMKAISMHVFNMNNTFFVSPDFQEIRTYVKQYLLRNAKSRQSLIERTGQRGCYRLNTQGVAYVRQFPLQFREKTEGDEDEEEVKPQQDLSLSLFD